MKLKIRLISLVLVACLPLQTPASTNLMGDMMTTMFRMMLAMANHMSSALDNSGSFNMGNSFGSGINPWTSFGPWNSISPWPGSSPWAAGMPGAMPGGWPGSSPMMTPWTTPAYGQPWSTPNRNWQPARQWPAQQNRPNRPPVQTRLNGQWLGANGEILEILNGRYQLIGQQGAIRGVARASQQQLTLYSPTTGVTLQYRYQTGPAGLMLQTPSGQTLYFQRRDNSGAYTR